MYDRQTLLDLQGFAEIKLHHVGHKALPPHCRVPAPPYLGERRRCWEKLSGRLVRPKAYSVGSQSAHRLAYYLVSSRRLLDPVYTWLITVAGSEELFQPSKPRCSYDPHSRQCRAVLGNLQPLGQDPCSVSVTLDH